MREQFLHYVWQKQRFNHADLRTIDGRSIQIIHPGKLNYHDGPDFFDARIKIDHTLWAGHVEIHLNGSDWHRHGHEGDTRYKNLILHVVYQHDTEGDIADCATLELAGLIPRSVYDRYLRLEESLAPLPCQHFLPEVDAFSILFWKERLIVSRMEEKLSYIESTFEKCGQDWNRLLFVVLCRYFGQGPNSEAFEDLALRLPYQAFVRAANDRFTLEACLLGSAGFLKGPFEDTYMQSLQKEFSFIQNKWSIEPLPPERWRWKHIRPAAFPSIRLTQLASCLSVYFPRFQQTLQSESFSQWVDVQPSDYWTTHYRPDQPSKPSNKAITKDFVRHLQLNVSIPLKLVYGKYQGKEEYLQECIETLAAMPAEQNKITRLMESYGFENENALDSQALMYLKQHFCDKKNCLNCGIGIKILESRDADSRHSDVHLVEDEVY